MARYASSRRARQMHNHFSTLGFEVQSGQELYALMQQVAGQAQTIRVRRGRYLWWAGGSGEELWIQTDTHGRIVGANPHFRGQSSVRVGLTTRVRREGYGPLDGAFHGWADPEQDKADSGAYPFVFDVPDAAMYVDLRLPCIAGAQIAAFAHEIAFYPSPDAYLASQAEREVKFASQSFIPTGLFMPQDTVAAPPEAMAMITGHVVEAGLRENAISGAPFIWALVDTLGGTYDVVVDRTLLPEVPPAGSVLSGSFWLAGRLTSYPKRERGWLERILGGTR
jgi:hypothetical protein